jgi:hypothetical protein
MNMSGLVPSYDNPSRTATNPPTSRAFQPTTSHLDINMPLFSTHPLTTSVPYQPGAFAFDSLSVNPYNMQQAFPVSYPPSIPHAVTYPGGTADMQTLPTVREARNGFPMERGTPPVKAENNSPVQPSQLFTDMSYSEDYKNANPESGETSGIDFSTDVDTLMKAIQAKAKPAQQRQQPKVPDLGHYETQATRDSLSPQEEEPKTGQKSKKRYQCSMPNCNKSFYQKTHLEIHTRAHTGVKPFVSDTLLLFAVDNC